MFDVSPTAGMVVARAEDRTPMRLFWDVCDQNDVSPDLVRGPQKYLEIVEVRRKVARVLRDHGCSLPEIGRIMNRHHATILNLLSPRPRKQRVAQP